MNVALVAAICGLMYFGGTSKIGYHLTTAMGSPVVIGFVLGLMAELKGRYVLTSNRD